MTFWAIANVFENSETSQPRTMYVSKPEAKAKSRSLSKDEGEGGVTDQENPHQSNTDQQKRMGYHLERDMSTKTEDQEFQHADHTERSHSQKEPMDSERDDMPNEIEILRKKIYRLKSKNQKLCTDKEYLSNEINEDKKRLQKYEAKVIDMESWNDDLQNTIKHLYSECFKPYIRKKQLDVNLGHLSAASKIIPSLLPDAMEADDLRAQVRSLKDQVDGLQQQLVSTIEKYEVVSDEQLVQDFNKLVSAIKALSRSIKTDNATSLLQTETSQSLLIFMGIDERRCSEVVRKKCIAEAFIWGVIYHFIFRGPFCIFGEEYTDLSSSFTKLFGKSGIDRWPLPSEAAERWRSNTVDSIVSKIGKDNFLNKLVEVQDQKLANSAWHQRLWAAKLIFENLKLEDLPENVTHISRIINKAVALALKMFIQRSRIQLTIPKIGENYRQGSSASLNVMPDCEDVELGTVMFILNPGLTKWGDVHGKNLDQRTDLVPSLVIVEEREL